MCRECKNKILSGHGQSPESAELFSLKKVKKPEEGEYMHPYYLFSWWIKEVAFSGLPVSCSESGVQGLFLLGNFSNTLVL